MLRPWSRRCFDNDGLQASIVRDRKLGNVIEYIIPLRVVTEVDKHSFIEIIVQVYEVDSLKVVANQILR